MSVRFLIGDARSRLRDLPDESVHCVVTSPPYFGLRDYGTAQWEGGDPACDHAERHARNDGGRERIGGFNGSAKSDSNKGAINFRSVCGKCGARRIDSQIGLEESPAAYVAELVAVFRGVRRVLRSDGVCWLNLGDSAGKGKQLLGIPWKVAFALQDDGWVLRQDIIWSKANPMPESITDRCCKSHEYVFLLTKRERYYFDHIAIQEDAAGAGGQRVSELQGNAPVGQLLQEQSTLGRSDEQVRDVHRRRTEGLRQKIQRIEEGEGEGAPLLLFGKGAGEQGCLSPEAPAHGRAKRAISDRWEGTRKGAEIQSSPQALRPKRQGQSDEGAEGQEVCQDRQRAICEAQGGDQAPPSVESGELHADTGTMARYQGGLSEPVCLLSPDISAARNGSPDSALARGPAHSGEHCSGVPEVQREQGGQAAGKRTRRSVWNINSEPSSLGHFALMPTALPELCIRAGTSERGCCPHCGKGWARVVEREAFARPPIKLYGGTLGHNPTGKVPGSNTRGMPQRPATDLGWQPSCTCPPHDPVPATVLDCFAGAGTTGLVADRLGRNAILIELNPAYAATARTRLEADAGMFACLEAAE